MDVNRKVRSAPENIKTKTDLKENSTTKRVFLIISRRFWLNAICDDDFVS